MNEVIGNLLRSRGIVLSVLLLPLAIGCGGNGNDVSAFDDVELTPDMEAFGDPAMSPAEPAPGRSPDEVVLRIEGEEITRGEIMQEVNMLMGRMQGQVPPEQMAAMREEIIQGAQENLITRHLLLNRVKADQIEVEDEEIDDVIAMFRQQLPPGASLEYQLAQTGMTMADLRSNLKQELAVNRMLEKKVEGLLEPSDEDIVAFYEEHLDDFFTMPDTVEASHILINTQNMDEAEVEAARQELEEIRAQLLEGADFASLAESHSACPSSAQGGSLGRFPRGQMVPAFEEAAFSQAVGEVGDIVQTQFGFHIVMVTDRHEAGVQSLEESRPQIADHLTREKRDGAVRDYIQELREAADVEVVGTL